MIFIQEAFDSNPYNPYNPYNQGSDRKKLA